jgi:hypothetical protein
MDWADLTLRAVRAFGAIAGAAAGIAALLTEGAFERRQQPLFTGRWKEFPLARYKITRWGGLLLSIILIAPMSQFVGDWIKDYNDEKSLENTAKNIRDNISNTVADTTERAHHDIVNIVESESKQQSQDLAKASAQISRVAERASQILKEVDRSLQPLGTPEISVQLELDCKSQNYASLCEEAPKVAQQLYKSSSSFKNAWGISLDWSDFPRRSNILIPLFGIIFKDAEDAERFLQKGCFACDASGDLMLDISPDNYSKIKSLDLMFYKQENKVLLLSDKTITPELNTRTVVSFSDLAEETLILSEANHALESLTPVWFGLTTPTGQSVHITSFTAKVVHGHKVFVARFPE